jgi:AcrR family transcriptional regulator
VLDLASVLFARHGYKATSLELVADQLGVTRQALYYHFRNKQDILAALFDELMTALDESLVEAVPEAGEATFEALLRAHIEVIMSDVDLAALLLHAWPELARTPGLDATGRRVAYERKFARAYRRGVKEGRLRPLNPDRAARTLLAAANSVTSWHRPGTPGRRAQATRDTVELLTHGFRRPGGASSADRAKPSEGSDAS